MKAIEGKIVVLGAQGKFYVKLKPTIQSFKRTKDYAYNKSFFSKRQHFHDLFVTMI